jgi:hypothetical protein
VFNNTDGVFVVEVDIDPEEFKRKVTVGFKWTEDRMTYWKYVYKDFDKVAKELNVKLSCGHPLYKDGEIPELVVEMHCPICTDEMLPLKLRYDEYRLRELCKKEG